MYRYVFNIIKTTLQMCDLSGLADGPPNHSFLPNTGENELSPDDSL